MDKHQFRPQEFGLPTEAMLVLELPDHQTTIALGKSLGEVLRGGDFLGLVGTLGAGKTTLMQGLVWAFDAGLEATSPTYGLTHLYESEPVVVHMDLYRLETMDDLESIGYWDYLQERENIVCVEWLDRISEAWPGDGIVVELRREGNSRVAFVWGSEVMHATVQELSKRFSMPTL